MAAVNVAGGTPFDSRLIVAGIVLVFIGFMLLFLGFLYGAFKSGGKGEFGGVVVIGPLPIIFGSSERAVKIAVVAAIVLMALALLIMFLPYWLLRGAARPPG